MELIKNGSAAMLMETGAVLKTAFCGPCFGAGDTPSNNGFSIRHSTRNFPNREGSKLQNGQIASVALMDARSIAATAANKGYLTAATDLDVEFRNPKYFFDSKIYENRVFDSHGVADPSVEIHFGPNIKDWPAMSALPENLVLKVVSEIHDPVTTTDELIPSGETSSYRSNPLGLAEFTLSRRDPEYVGRTKKVDQLEKARVAAGEEKELALEPDLANVFAAIRTIAGNERVSVKDTEVGSMVYAVKPGDGSAREQAASCQRVIGGLANICKEYATKRYRSNVMNWGMLPFQMEAEPDFEVGDYIYVPGVRKALDGDLSSIKAYVLGNGKAVKDQIKELDLYIADMTPEERAIVKAGCLINYNRSRH